MSETVITVQGQHSAFYPAERATVQLIVGFDGPQRSTVFDAANACADGLRARITALHDGKVGPITWWSSDRIQVWSDRPWNQEGKQLPLVHRARIGFTAKFSDFEILAKFLEELASVEGVTIGSIEWALTEAHRTAVTAEVRTRAVKDAIDKATVYAKAIGLGSVRAVAIADPGMLGDQVGASGHVEMAMASRAFKAADAGGGPALSLKPEDIEVSATVDARFVAG
ncbi:MAG TPA: SIMPL domain-containing protein [Terrimesophilobacter sp.]|nr:SIMPL domain-containing protein [Terrimesophilobacter sp.]